MHAFIYIICLANHAGSTPPPRRSDVSASPTLCIQPWKLERNKYYDRELEIARQALSDGKAYGTGNLMEKSDKGGQAMQPIDEDMSQGFQSFGKPQFTESHITYYPQTKKTY